MTVPRRFEKLLRGRARNFFRSAKCELINYLPLKIADIVKNTKFVGTTTVVSCEAIAWFRNLKKII